MPVGDFRPTEGSRPTVESQGDDRAEAASYGQPEALPEDGREPRELNMFSMDKFGNNFKDFRPQRVTEDEPDPKGLSVPASAPSLPAPAELSTENPGQSALQKQIAAAEKDNTQPKESVDSTQTS